MRIYLNLFAIMSLVFIVAAQASAKNTKSSKSCTDMQVLVTAAEQAIQEYKEYDEEEGLSDYLMIGGDPVLGTSSAKDKDLWTVPVVVDGEGCYGDVVITLEAGTCNIVGKPTFDGVSCTDE